MEFCAASALLGLASMTMNESNPPLIPPGPSLFRQWATTFRIAGVTVLILLLLIPLQMVRSILRERLGRRDEAVSNITASWGREQRLIGPVLIVP
jgi:hypothetical protein